MGINTLVSAGLGFWLCAERASAGYDGNGSGELLGVLLERVFS